jgi:serine/threonine protein kinase
MTLPDPVPESADTHPAGLDTRDVLSQLADEPATIIQDPGGLHVTRRASGEGPGSLIGRYRLIEPLGEGGFGIVWRAEQSEPIRREVALKVIKPGMDSREIIARFEAERQALALMDHPNIAGVLDAGTTDSGRPFFVMELVKGVPITDYCDVHRLTIRQRLELFIPVCQAVQHAHQKAILHRDLKPSNILVMEVDGKPVPKVIDFGIAKALGTSAEAVLQASIMRTQAGMVIGTPQYMSPEQAGSVPDVDTRSDIYTLGVILYELLVGEPPLSHELMRLAALDEMLRLIREDEPRRPSSRFTPTTDLTKTTATLRHTEPKKLGHALRGDLDWIVMKALEKDRIRRYETAMALAQDLQRHLHQEPVSAGPPTLGYRVVKFLRRHRSAAVAVAAVVLALAAGTVISVWQAIRAETQKNLATSTAAEMARQASSASLALAGERLRNNAWAEGMAYTAAALRFWPENPVAASQAANLLFDRKAFCLDSWLPLGNESPVAIGYPMRLSRMPKQGALRLFKHELDESCVGSWRELEWSGQKNASLGQRWLLSPGGRFAVALGGSKVTIFDLMKPMQPGRSVPLTLAPEYRKTSFSQDGSFLIIASLLMVEVIDLGKGSKTWTFSEVQGMNHVAISNDGRHAATALVPLPVASHGSLSVVSPREKFSKSIEMKARVSMAAGSKDGSLLVACTQESYGNGRLHKIIRRSDGSYVADEKGWEINVRPLSMRVSDDGKSLAIIGYVNETQVKVGRVNLEDATPGIDWLGGATSGPGLYWPADAGCYGFAANGTIAILTTHSLDVGNQSTVFCFNLDSLKGSSETFGARIVAVAPADEAPLAALSAVPLPPSVEMKGEQMFWRTHVFIKRLDETGGADSASQAEGSRAKKLLGNVRVAYRGAEMALSPDGGILALAGPYPEQASIHEVSTGKNLGFIRINAELKPDPTEFGLKPGVNLGVTTPATLKSLSFLDNQTSSCRSTLRHACRTARGCRARPQFLL